MSLPCVGPAMCAVLFHKPMSLGRWLPDAAARKRALVENPAVLYGV